MNILNQLEKDSEIIMNLLNPTVVIEEVTKVEVPWYADPNRVYGDDTQYDEESDNDLAFN